MRNDCRLLVVSNRLPCSVQRVRGEWTLRPACGGLAAALGAVHRYGENLWIGWPGDCDALTPAQRDRLDGELRADRVIPVTLSGREVASYYDGICNSVLWPVLHYLLDHLPMTFPDFQMYRAVNERFTDAIVREYRSGDVVWIHDYHLMVAPAMVRLRVPDARIGFFLHTPFPAADVFRVLPWRRELLEGLLGSTIVGFQTERDAQNFGDTLNALTEYRVDGSTVITGGREVRFGAYPIGIDPLRLEAVHERSSAGFGESSVAASGRQLLLGVDRLDYTKGIPRRIAAFERLLDENPHLRGSVELVQVAVPSRSHVPPYGALRQEVESLIASVNARFGSIEWTPVRYVADCLAPHVLAQLYRAADVMLVTSVRDGMNLVAKEFILARHDEDGVLVLSELAGASEELHEAILVNPYSVEALTQAMATALTLDRHERRLRMRALRERVATGTVEAWVERFTGDLVRTESATVPSADRILRSVRTAVTRREEVSLVLTYEGVLVPQLEQSDTRRPDPEIVGLLCTLRSRTNVSAHVISGFAHSTLGRWFEGVPATLWAEHGLWQRERGTRRWRRTQGAAIDWADDVRELLDQFSHRCPGAFVERRGVELVWNFGRAERLTGHTQAQMLAALLREAADALGFIVEERDHAITVRPAGLTIERTLRMLLDARRSSGPVVMIDVRRQRSGIRDVLAREDLLVTVGETDRTSDLSLANLHDVRAFLWEVAAAAAERSAVHLPPDEAGTLLDQTPVALS